MLDSLGDRIKRYEEVSKLKLVNRMPVIIRLDGSSFHTYCKKFNRPFDEDLSLVFKEVCKKLINTIQGAKFCYRQSDEISILLMSYKNITTGSWFDNNLQKIVSISSSICTAHFNYYIMNNLQGDSLTKLTTPIAYFDSRAFNIPENDVTNYFIWRQRDAIRNSIQALGQSYFSQKELYGLSQLDIKNKLLSEKGICWEHLPIEYQRGFCVINNTLALHIPIFSENRNYIENVIKNNLPD